MERRAVFIQTAFGGPGARDTFELVTRAVTEQRFILGPGLAQPEMGWAWERSVFCLRYGEQSVMLVLREGVRDRRVH